jgi:hypothetical protein
MRKFYLIYDMLDYRYDFKPAKTDIYKRPQLWVKSRAGDEFYIQISRAKERVSPEIKASHIAQIAYDNGIPQLSLYFVTKQLRGSLWNSKLIDIDGRKQISFDFVPF